jgi:hypothetical protein
MTFFSVMRLVVKLGHINKNLAALVEVERERLELDRQRLSLEHPEWLRAGGRLPARSGVKAQLGVISTAELNKQYQDKMYGRE